MDDGASSFKGSRKQHDKNRQGLYTLKMLSVSPRAFQYHVTMRREEENVLVALDSFKE